MGILHTGWGSSISEVNDQRIQFFFLIPGSYPDLQLCGRCSESQHPTLRRGTISAVIGQAAPNRLPWVDNPGGDSRLFPSSSRLWVDR